MYRRANQNAIFRVPLYRAPPEIETEEGGGPAQLTRVLSAFVAGAKPAEIQDVPIEAWPAIAHALYGHFKAFHESEGETHVFSHDEFYRDWTLGVRFVKGKHVHAWSRKLHAVRLQSVADLAERRKGKRPDEVPELYGRVISPEALEVQRDVMADILTRSVAYLDGVEGLGQEDFRAAESRGDAGFEERTGGGIVPKAFTASLIEFLLEELPYERALDLMKICQEVQEPKRRQRFLAPRPGDVG